MIAEVLYNDPLRLFKLYISGPPWAFLVVVVFLGFLLVVITRINRSRSRRSRRQKSPNGNDRKIWELITGWFGGS